MELTTLTKHLNSYAFYNRATLDVHTAPEPLIMVTYEGIVFYVPITERKVHCTYNDDNSTYTCPLKFISSIHNGLEVSE